MGDRTRDDVVTERIRTGKRIVNRRDLRRRTREGEGIQSGARKAPDADPERTPLPWPPADDET